MPCSCALAPPGGVPLDGNTRAGGRYVDATLACDDDGDVYIAGSQELQGETRIVVAASRQHGENWDPLLHVVSTGSSGERRRPHLATGASREVYALWEDTRQGPRDLYFNRSLDGGLTWLPSDLRINTNPAGTSHLQAPSIACDDRGNVYAVWLDDREGYDAFYANRSRDRGQSWLPTDVRITSLALGVKSAPRLFCDATGDLFVVWVERRGSDQQVWFNTSYDHGETWLATDQQLSRAAGRAFTPDLGVLGSDVLCAAWLQEGSGRADVFFARSDDRGRSWDFQPAPFSTGLGEQLYNPTSPRVCSDGLNHVYVAWHTVTANGGTRIILKSSQDSGRSFQQTVIDRPSGIGQRDLLGSAPALAEPFRVACDRAGNVYLAWVEEQAGGPGIGFERVADYGRNWLRTSSPLEEMGHAPATVVPPALCSDSFGNVYLLWNDGSGGPRFATSPFYGDSGWRYRSF